jgi:hypothetical protein
MIFTVKDGSVEFANYPTDLTINRAKIYIDDAHYNDINFNNLLLVASSSGKGPDTYLLGDCCDGVGG